MRSTLVSKTNPCQLLRVLSTLSLVLLPARAFADQAFFVLDNIYTDRGGAMTGTFTWTYDPGDFENGTGLFTELDIPHTAHGIEDLVITIETGQLEFSLSGSFHDDGVDVMLVLTQPLSPNAPAPLDLDPNESKYSIGGNGFIDGYFISGSIAPFVPGDLDGDGDVDGVDLSGFFSFFTGPDNGPPGNPDADLDGDDDIDGVDLSQAFSMFTGPLVPTSVPEPAEFMLLGVGGLACLTVRTRNNI